ncbi:hypothetical protein HQ545_07455, partial [Candidatus Woesearchaeota archaeon]|nr:hypothetical protein [Candidatus Woesearchaeota archaeon]
FDCTKNRPVEGIILTKILSDNFYDAPTLGSGVALATDFYDYEDGRIYK